MTLYLDTSSLVKLYVSETGSDAIRQLVAGATVVATSVVAYVETRAALADERVIRHLNGAEIRKVIFVPNKLLSLVIAGR